MSALTDQLATLIERGGWVMLPLIALSVVSLTLVVERSWFWLLTHRASRRAGLLEMAEALRKGERDMAKQMAGRDPSPYGRMVRRLLSAGPSDAMAMEVVELQRPRFERFMVTLSTIITAAPMLGILGTVTGIIKSFNLLSDQRTLTDPTAVSAGIAEALITTAFGLVVALITLFPYMIFRGQVDRAIGQMESLIAAAQECQRSSSSDHRPAAEPSAAPRTDRAESGRRAVSAATTD